MGASINYDDLSKRIVLVDNKKMRKVKEGDTGAMLYQLSYEATHWEQGQLIEFMSFPEE